MGLWILRGVPGAIAALSINTCPSVTAEPMTYRGRPGAVSDNVDGEPGREGKCRFPWPIDGSAVVRCTSGQ
jgi:hypothetical protein